MQENNDIFEMRKTSSDRDVIYTLRTVSQNQMQMIALADQKANILIGIISVIFTLLFTRNSVITSFNQVLSFLFVGFIGVEMIAILLSLLVIFPRKVNRPVSNSIKNLVNPIFFGNFSQFQRQDLVDYLMTNLDNDHSARSLLITDIYQVGLVLKDKYTLLRYAYICTGIGLVLLSLTLFLFLSI